MINHAQGIEHFQCGFRHDENIIGEANNAARRFLADCETPPNVILLGMQLPDMEGIELLRHIRSNDRTKSLPVLMLIEPEDRTQKNRTFGLGVNGYIPHVGDATLLADHLTIFRHLFAGPSC